MGQSAGSRSGIVSSGWRGWGSHTTPHTEGFVSAGLPCLLGWNVMCGGGEGEGQKRDTNTFL